MKEINYIQKYHFNKTIGRYLGRIRRSAGFSRTQVVLATDMSQRELCGYETGAIPLPSNLFVRLIELCDADHFKAYDTINKAGEFLRTH